MRPIRVLSKLALLACGVALGNSAAACVLPDADGGAAGAFQLSGKAFNVVIRSDPAPLRLDAFFKLQVAGCAVNGGATPTGLEVDARMPAHGHGMNYRPSVVTAGPGRFIVEGLLFHMRGEWVIDVLLQSPEARERLRLAVSLE